MVCVRLDTSTNATYTEFPGDYSGLEPPDPISNSEVKQSSADDSVGLPHVKVGHCQTLILKTRSYDRVFFYMKCKLMKLSAAF